MQLSERERERPYFKLLHQGKYTFGVWTYKPIVYTKAHKLSEY